MKNNLIRNKKIAGRVVDNFACSLDNDFCLTGNPVIMMSDIDGFIEQHWTRAKAGMKYRTAFLFVEHKAIKEDGTECGMPKGQELSYLSLVSQAKYTDYGVDEKYPTAPRGSFAMIVECYHEQVPEGETIKSHDCVVKRIYSSTDQKWIYPKYKLGLPELVMCFYYLIGLRQSAIPTPEERALLIKLRDGDDSYGPQKTI